MSLTMIENRAVRTLDQHLSSGFTIDLGGLIGIIASQYTPSDPCELASLAAGAPFLLIREPDLRCAIPEGLTPYLLLRANTYEHLAERLREECAQWKASEAATR